MGSNVIIYVADAGSAAKNNFHWVSSRDITVSSTSSRALAEAMAADLNKGNRVALGYECPLFVPIEEDESSLGCARVGECQEATGNRPFTAGAGASVFATGLQSLAWVLHQTQQLTPDVTASTQWNDFKTRSCNLFVWEAFVSGSEKAYPASHAGDAALAISAFQQVMNNPSDPTRIKCTLAFSVAGAAIVRAGLSADVTLVSKPCVVLRPIFSPEESLQRLADYKARQAAIKKAKKDKAKNGQKAEPVENHDGRFADSAELEPTIKGNLEGAGNGI